jgi:hypothetical protein
MSSIEFAEQFIQLVSALDPEGLAEAISHLPGGSSAAVALSSDVLLAQADSPMSGGHLVVDSTSEPRQWGSMDAGDQNCDVADDDDEPWSNL